METLKNATHILSPTEFRNFREQLSLTQVELAKILGISPSTLTHWECGQYPIPIVASLALLGLYSSYIETNAAVNMNVDVDVDAKEAPPSIIESDTLSASLLHNDAFTHALQLFRSYAMNNFLLINRSDVGLAKSLSVSVDQIRRWIRGESIPTNPARIIELLIKMILSIEIDRVRRRKTSQDARERMNWGKMILTSLGVEGVEKIEKRVNREIEEVHKDGKEEIEEEEENDPIDAWVEGRK